MSYTPKDMTVWIEIPVSDLSKSMTFYTTVTGNQLKREQMGPQEVAMFQVQDQKTGVAGHLYEGKPANDGQGPTVHLGVEGKLEAAMERVWQAGGKVIADPMPLPVGRFVYCQDPDGNSIGLYEAA